MSVDKSADKLAKQLQTVQALIPTFLEINDNSELEFEVKFRNKFGSFEKPFFVSSVNPSLFYELIGTFRQRSEQGIDIEQLPLDIFTDQSIKNYPDRLIHNHNTNSDQFIRKIAETHIPGIGTNPHIPPRRLFKMTLCKETPITSKIETQNFKKRLVTFASDVIKRYKERTSFVHSIVNVEMNTRYPVLRFDFTKVILYEFKKEPKTKFEIEMEYIGNTKASYVDYVNENIKKVILLFVQNLEFMLINIQKARFGILLASEEHNYVLKKYTEMLNIDERGDLFRGAQPETMHQRHLYNVYEQEYWIAEKSDGDRYLALIIPNFADPTKHAMYFLSRYLHVIKSNVNIAFKNSKNFPLKFCAMLDGELVNTKSNGPKYLAFDMIYDVEQKDVRYLKTKGRYDLLKTHFGPNSIIVSSTSSNLDDILGFKVKKMELLDKDSLSTDVIRRFTDESNFDYDTDGLIFTPNERYPETKKWRQLLKWKPLDKNSIDLWVEKDPIRDNLYQLYTNTSVVVIDDHIKGIIYKKILDESSNDETFMVLTSDKELICVQKSHIRFIKGGVVKINFPPQPTITSTAQLATNVVTEFTFDGKLLIPMRNRKDKTSKGYLGSNYITVAIDVWESMKSDLSLRDICDFDINKIDCDDDQTTISSEYVDNIDVSFVKSYKDNFISTQNSTRSTSKIENLKKFHSYIKTQLLETYSIETKRVSLDTKLAQIGGKREFKHNSNGWVFPFQNQTLLSLKLLGIPEQLIVQQQYEIFVYHRPFLDTNIRFTEKQYAMSVLDIGVGKGGDLWKYVKAKVEYLVGVDNEIFLLQNTERGGAEDSAIERWKSIRKNHSNTVCNFHHCDGRDNICDLLKNKGVFMDFDLVNCFFAMHYFFKSQTDLHKFLTNVKDNLTYNGMFVGTILDGNLVYNLLRKHNGLYQVKNSSGQLVFEIKRQYDDTIVGTDGTNETNGTDGTDGTIEKLPMYSQEIQVYLNDSIIQEYIHRDDSKKEYIVDFEKFQKIALDYDLQVCESKPFMVYYGEFKSNYRNRIKLEPHEEKISSLFRTFVFRKTSNSKFYQETNVMENTELLLRNQLEMIQKQQLQFGITDVSSSIPVNANTNANSNGNKANTVYGTHGANNRNANNSMINLNNIFKNFNQSVARKRKTPSGANRAGGDIVERMNANTKKRTTTSSIPKSDSFDIIAEANKGLEKDLKRKNENSQNGRGTAIVDIVDLAPPNKKQKPRQYCSTKRKCKSCKTCVCAKNGDKCDPDKCGCPQDMCVNKK